MLEPSLEDSTTSLVLKALVRKLGLIFVMSSGGRHFLGGHTGRHFRNEQSQIVSLRLRTRRPSRCHRGPQRIERDNSNKSCHQLENSTDFANG